MLARARTAVARGIRGGAPLKRAFTGRLPVTWPKSRDQLPINVGDRSYDPLYPFGWGLTSEKAVRKALADAGVGQAARSIKDWGRQPERVFAALAVQARILELTHRDDHARSDAVMSAARHLAQRAIVEHGAQAATARFTSDAEHLLLRGRPTRAVLKLARAYRVAIGG